jgi:phage protein D
MSDQDPCFFVRVSPSGKNPERVDQSAKILSLSYEDDESKADKLVLSVDNFDLANFDAPIWKTGNHVEVSWGYPGNMSPTRQMKIQAVKGSIVLSVECLDEQILMQKVQRVRTFERMSRSQVARQIAQEYGYGDALIHVDDTEEILEQVTQARMTDAALLRDMAKREGFEFYVDFDGFHFHARRLGEQPHRRFTYYTDKGRGNLLSWALDNDIFSAGKTGGVTVPVQDPKKKPRKQEVVATNATQPARVVLAPTVGLQSFVAVGNGKITLQQSETAAKSAGHAILPSTEKTEASAKRKAAGTFAKSQMQAAELTLEVRGDPQMLAKRTIEVLGIGKTLSGLYYVKSCKHTLAGEYKCSIKCKRDGKSAASTSAGQGFTKDQPKPDEQSAGKPNKGKAPEDAGDKLRVAVQGGKVIYTQGGA